MASDTISPSISAPAAPDKRFARPELLAPAGNADMIRAAIENGADAVYFGVHELNARLRAENFTLEGLPEMMAGLHERGVKGYLTLNTLVFPSELEEAARVLRAASEAGVDAVLVQDLGLAALAARLVPDLPIHASTQMTLTCAESTERAAEMGLRLERVVAPRELSRKELELLAGGAAGEIEVFVHGALCVAYSGQCLTSEALGGRSANRGECAQACRLPYDLVVGGRTLDVGDLKYVLSPKDLAALEDLGDLIKAGVASFKIEGRLKTPEYVAATVSSYRRAIDEALAGAGPNGPARPRMDAATAEKLEMTFSRGFTGGYLHEIDHQAVVEGRFPKKRGRYLGRVADVTARGIAVDLIAAVKLGDGVVFDAGKPGDDEEGGSIYEIEQGRRRVEAIEPRPGEMVRALLAFAHGRINPARVNAGDRIWKTSDPKLAAELRASYENARSRFRRPLKMRVEGGVGAIVKLTLEDEFGRRAEAEDTAPAELARARPLTRETLEAQLGRLGDTPFYLAELEIAIEGEAIVPMSRLNDLRRRAAEKLIAMRREAPRRGFDSGALAAMRRESCGRTEDRSTAEGGCATSLREDSPKSDMISGAGRGEGSEDKTGLGVRPTLSVLCRTLDQVKAAAARREVETIYTDFEDIRLHREARTMIPRNGARFAPAALRIVKPGEAPTVRKLLEADPDAILVRNLASWQILRAEAPELPLIGDYSLNIANELTAGLLHRDGLARMTPSYDLNIDQLLDLLRAAPPEWFEVTIHQYIPMFHMEHCVFCRFLSEGTDFTNCGRPCETKPLALRDRLGYEHPVKADAGCRNTVYNAIAQSASEYLAGLMRAGAAHFRIEFLLEDARAVRETIDSYAGVLAGKTNGSDLWRRLRAKSKLGVTRGSMDRE